MDTIEQTLKAATSVAIGPIWFTGHSLGAAIAALSAHRLCVREARGAKRIQAVYGCGMPRLGTERFASRYVALPVARGGTLGDQTFRLVYGDDLIPHVPPSQMPFGFRHVGRTLKAPHAGHFDAASLAPGTLETPGDVDAAFLKQLFSGLVPDLTTELLPYLAENRIAVPFVAALPRGLRDHLMDRYLGAVG